MKQILHIIKGAEAGSILRLIEEGSGASRSSLLLIQDAVGLKTGIRIPVFVLEEDLGARNAVSGYEKIDYRKVLEMIFKADSVKVW